MKATFVGRTIDRTPDNPSLSSNGGDYFFMREVYRLNDGRRFVLYRTSAEFDYCSIVGSFTKTRSVPLMIDGTEVTIDGEPFYVWAAEWLAYQGYASPHILDEKEESELDFN